MTLRYHIEVAYISAVTNVTTIENVVSYSNHILIVVIKNVLLLAHTLKYYIFYYPVFLKTFLPCRFVAKLVKVFKIKTVVPKPCYAFVCSTIKVVPVLILSELFVVAMRYF